jgi:dethiobiotin synthetase
MKLFITGISTDVGKTIASAIIVEALEADYWKPIQAGDLNNSDSQKIKSYISNDGHPERSRRTIIHDNSYKLNTPASPHFSAELDGLIINLQNVNEPKTKNHLVIEGLIFLLN